MLMAKLYNTGKFKLELTYEFFFLRGHFGLCLLQTFYTKPQPFTGLCCLHGSLLFVMCKVTKNHMFNAQICMKCNC